MKFRTREALKTSPELELRMPKKVRRWAFSSTRALLGMRGHQTGKLKWLQRTLQHEESGWGAACM